MSVKEDTERVHRGAARDLSRPTRGPAPESSTPASRSVPRSASGSVDFHYVSPQDWAEQATNVQAQRIEYESFHLDAYTLLNARVGYPFFKNRAELSGVAFNLLNRRHREYPLGRRSGSGSWGMFSYRFFEERVICARSSTKLVPLALFGGTVAVQACGNVPTSDPR